MTLLEKVSNACIIAVSIAIGVVLIKDHFFPHGSRPIVGMESKMGQVLPGLDFPGVRGGSHTASIVLGLSTTCRYCDESAPFYRELSALAAAIPDRLRLIAVFPHESSRSSRYLEQHGIAVSRVLFMPLGTLSIGATPTLMLLDAEGRLRHYWVGLLGEAREAEVLVRLKEICPTCRAG